MPLSQCNNIVIRNIDMDCNNFFDVGPSDKYALNDFTFEHIRVSDGKNAFQPSLIGNAKVNDVVINGQPVIGCP